MKIIHIQAFDLDRYDYADDLPGLADHGYYVYPLTVLQYRDGYLSGRALRQGYVTELPLGGGGNASRVNPMPFNQSTVRICWWAKNTVEMTGTGNWAPYLFLNGWSPDVYFGVQVSRQGVFRLARGGPYGGADAVLSVDSANGFGYDLWRFHELYFDATSGLLQFYQDGILQCQGTLDMSVIPSGSLSFFWNRPGGSGSGKLLYLMDHIVITDGDRPSPGKIHALAPTAAWDKRGNNSGRLHGRLVVNGESYQTKGVTSYTNGGGLGSNETASIIYFLFPQNPAGGDWTYADYTGLDGWGVCTSGFTGSGNYSRLPSLGLSVVETMSDPNGFPIIRTLPPGGLTMYSGVWVKSNPELSLSAHINDIPRLPVDRPDGNYDHNQPPFDKQLTTRTNGCILFKPGLGAKPFEKTGLTFAEEFRTDYTDWYTVYGYGWNFESWFKTGYSILADGSKDFQSNYVSVNYENAPLTGAYFQGVWDYALDRNTGRWSTKQQIYRLADTDYKHGIAKLKVRGRGKTLQIRISSEENKNFIINGWSAYVTGNQNV